MSRILKSAVASAAIVTLLAGCGADSGEAPYAGYDQREIAALAPERVATLLAGGGAGYALAAEVNGYPGPKHVLELASELELTAEQRERTEKLYAAMTAETVPLGERLVALADLLDEAFKRGVATEEELAALTGSIAETEGRLRYAHLKTHLSMRSLLTTEQNAAYAALRGYGAGSANGKGHEAGHEAGHDGGGH